MNKFFISISMLFIGYFLTGFYLSQFEFKLMGKRLNVKSLQSNYKVHQNIYTDLTIGSGQTETLIAAAKDTGSDFLLITDLNPTIPVENDFYSSNIGLLFGSKLTRESQSITFYSESQKDFRFNNRILKTDKESLIIRNLESQNTEIINSDGIDIINLKNMAYRVWEKKKISTIWSLIFYPFNPKMTLIRLFRDPEEELNYFDVQSQISKTNMYLSSEATAKAIPFANWLIKFPSYSTIFSIASERVLLNKELTQNILTDRSLILQALKSGSFYISIDTLGDSKGFDLHMFSNDHNKYYFMGDEIKMSSSLILNYKLPYEPSTFFEVVLYKNGQRIDHRSVAKGEFSIQSPGVYRIQVRLNTDLPFPDNNKWLTWIFSNNFYVK